MTDLITDIDSADLIMTLRTLVTELRAPRVSIDDELWTFDDIAQYLKLSQYTVEGRVVVQPGFPHSLQPCATVRGSKAVKRWFAGGVIKWARQNRAKIPLTRSAPRAA
ncbi:hypothetical protein V2K16_01940 [Pseudomonas alliivorans]|uniref:hypothetical protein n=1 Tax=Pseudomonas alliivorans TaxID=2810613 RepID=UPI001AE90178|nr:hypothetical protein [Pseudomonas alliivorans]MBP0938977.1 hypothetical protein [Pseudomonas alliivorans]MEE4878042.1 hypothetical protein [Pseudomonas alliivorans]MEE4928415.1 hypothetical protein [Pseudomonas alliivorans]MEE4933830.1 hypothetical protein [Pseudomonas alliivorans]MEE4938962.1 hypothetical protein [Pseudomonas alliivorans]